MRREAKTSRSPRERVEEISAIATRVEARQIWLCASGLR